MLNAGFQYLEQRDANDKITKDGVVGKNSPFATSDNSGIYDVIAEDLRWLKENVDDVKDTSDLEAIKQSVTDMYNDMKNDSSFGEATAKAQAEEAKKQAQVALESATNAKTYYDDITTKSTEVNDTIAEIKSYIEKAEALVESNKTLEQSISDSATVATNKAKSAANSATNAATSETNAKASETKAKTSETNAKVSETNAAKSESNAKSHMDATALSETHAKTSETNAKASQTASKTSETNAKASETNAKQYSINSSNSADLAKAWSVSTTSPDNIADKDSPTSKTQSSRTWALYSRDRAISAFKSETNAKASETASKTSETNAADSASRAKASETSASTSAVNAATSASNAKTSETNAKASETNASASKTDAATSETNAKSYMATAKEYMQKAQEALAAAQAIQSVVDTAKANAEKCLADVEAVKESLAKMITYQGSVDNYSDLPTNPQVGYSYNVKNADKTHGVNAGDNLIWNGTDWDNFGSYVDMSLFAELGKDVKFNSVTAKLIGNAATATKLATARTIALSGNATGSTTFDGSGNATINTTVSESAHAATATQVIATAPNGGGLDVIHAIMGDNDAARVRVYGDANNGALEIATGDDGTEPIYARQYKNSSIDKFTTVARTAAILDGNGNTSFPGTVTAASFTGPLNGNAATATNSAAATTVNATAPNGGAADLAFGTMAINDYARIRVYGKDDNGALEIATADGGNEPIYARQYTGAYDWVKGRPGTVMNEAAILDVNGNTKFPKNVTAASFTGPLNGTATNASHATNADSATTATNVSGKIYYSSDSPSVATNKLFTVKQAHKGDDNVPNNGLVIQTGPTGAAYNGKLYITDNGGDGVWIGGVASGKEVGWTRLVENKGSWNINSATATKLQTPRTISLTGNASGSGTFDGSGNVSINTTVSQAANATNADKLDGYHASDLFRHLGGNRTPVITDIFDRAGTIDMSTMSAADKARHKANINKASNVAQNCWNNSTGIHAYGGDLDIAGYNRGTLKLTQSYKNFDKILIVGSNDDADEVIPRLYDVWELAYLFSHSYRFLLFNDTGAYWELYGSVRTGTNTDYSLSTDTIWNTQGQTASIIAIYGIKY